MNSLRSMARAAALPDDAMTMGLLGYPVLQAADILMARATVVPVGLDNEEHIAIARECATVFNDLYGDLFPLPEARISRWPALPGVATGPGGSGAKMSKSLGNAVFLRDTADEVAGKIRTLGFDEADRRAPSGPALLVFARAFLGDDEATRMGVELVDGSLSLAAAHEAIIVTIEARLAPIRDRRSKLLEQTGLVEEIIVDGTIRAREVANATLQRTREAMGLHSLWSELVETTKARAKAQRRPY
jgi:tryptophanyl-tRNA synthetase